MFDQLGGLGGLVKGKTVAVKVNFIGVRWQRLGNALMEDTFWSHPRMIGVGGAPAGQGRRAPHPGCGRPLVHPETLRRGDGVHELEAAGHPERGRQRGIREHQITWGTGRNTRGSWCPAAALMFPGYDLNHSYEDLRCFRIVRQIERARRHGRHPLHEEHLRNDSDAPSMARTRGWTSRACARTADAAVCFTLRRDRLRRARRSR